MVAAQTSVATDVVIPNLNPYQNKSVIEPSKIYLPFSLPYNASLENEVSFVLYTQENPTLGQTMKLDQQWISSSFFNRSNPTKYVIHGWFNDQFTPYIVALKEAYLKHGKYNIVSKIIIFQEFNFI